MRIIEVICKCGLVISKTQANGSGVEVKRGICKSCWNKKQNNKKK